MKVAQAEAAEQAVQAWLSQQATATQAALQEGQATAMSFLQEPPDEETSSYVAHWLQILQKALGALHDLDLSPELREGQDTAVETTNGAMDTAGGCLGGGHKTSTLMPDGRPTVLCGGAAAAEHQGLVSNINNDLDLLGRDPTLPGQASTPGGPRSLLPYGMVEVFRPESAGSAHIGEAVGNMAAVQDMDIDGCGPGGLHPASAGHALPAMPARPSSSANPEQAGSSPALGERSAAALRDADPGGPAAGSALPNGTLTKDLAPGSISHVGEEAAARRQEVAAARQAGQVWCGGGSRIAEPSTLTLACPADVNPFTLAEALDALRELGSLHLPLPTLHASGLMTTVKGLMSSEVCPNPISAGLLTPLPLLPLPLLCKGSWWACSCPDICLVPFA